MQDHTFYMARCLQLAQLGKGATAPNPMVGAVLVYDGRIIGEGYHRQYGMTHAEVACLESVPPVDKQLIPQSTMYVRLEPCAHKGKTPSCALRLVDEKVKEVVVCNPDPFHLVQGRGFEILQQHDIVTSSGLLDASGIWLNRRFFCFHQQQRPYIVLKWAQTRSGFFAPLNRTRYQMSNRHSQQLVHRWRTEETAILVGTNTALHDDPQLTARLWSGPHPLRLVIDKDLSLPSSLRVFNSEAPTWVFNSVRESVEGNISYRKLDFSHSIIPQILSALYAHNILSVMVEGGAHLFNSFIRESLWDEARIFSTPDMLSDGIAAPMLVNATHAFTTEIGTDNLNVYVHTPSQYPYVYGMEL